MVSMKQLLDFFPLLLFFILYKFYLDLPDELILSINAWVPMMELTPGEPGDAIYLATLAAIVTTLLQVCAAAIIVRKVEKMPLITLALLIVFGGATLALKDPLFIQWKPTAINWMFALVFLGSQLIGDKPLIRRMMGHAIEIEEARVWRQLNLAWVGFFVLAGIANLLVAPAIDPLGFEFSEDTWVDFKLFGLMGMTIVFVIAQAFYLARYMPNTDEEEAG
jgi:intracellular septation protein